MREIRNSVETLEAPENIGKIRVSRMKSTVAAKAMETISGE